MILQNLAVCNGWPKTKAAYRLFDNDKLHEAHLLQAHQVETINMAL